MKNDKVKKWLYLILIFGGFFILRNFVPSGLDQAGWDGFLVLFVAVLLWLTEAVPMAVTAVFVLFFGAWVGFEKEANILANFASTGPFFLLAAMVIGQIFTKVGLGRRISLYVLPMFGNKAKAVLLAVMMGTCVVSMFLADIPTALVFFGLYYYFFSFKANSLLTELLQNIVLYGDKVHSSAYPVYLFGQAGAGDPLSMLLLTAAIAVLFGLTWLLLSRSFLSIATASGHVGRKVYRAKAVRCRSISSALLDRELRRFTSSANYMLNCGFGTLFLVLASGFLLWQGRELLELVSQSFPERSGAMPVLLAFVLCLLSAMNDTTAPSVSLEGKQLWLVQSLPVSPWQVLRAKLRLQLLITIPPMLLCLVCLLAVYPGSPLELLFIAVTALSYALLMALLGLFLSLKMPNLSWTNEVVPIKQSACVALSLFGGWAVAMIPGALYLLTGIGSLDPLLYLSVVTALLLILSAMLYLWVKKPGSCIFAAL